MDWGAAIEPLQPGRGASPGGLGSGEALYPLGSLLGMAVTGRDDGNSWC